MKKLSFNDMWSYKYKGDSKVGKLINLPHDAMIYEKRIIESAGGINTGWFEGFDYEYSKKFNIPKEYKDKTIIFEFEGVYKNAEVYINSKKAAFRPYGYTNFYVCADSFLKYGEENEIKVFAYNSDQPNSRWYSGAGIYRPVNMYVGDKNHIKLNGIKIRTMSLNPAIIEVEVKTVGYGKIVIDILDKDNKIKTVTLNTNGDIKTEIEVPNAKLWGCNNPHLYTCKVIFNTDEVEEKFGIRQIKWDSDIGFAINGKREILRGACIHHDNGVLGACCYPEAEERKIKILKENGYNAIRSAHNPCSKALLDACDRLGMLVMDEYVDVWYIHKTENDYVKYFEEWWEKDLQDMVEKDFNHPSVIMYSIGNEVSETAQGRGIKLTNEMTEYLHSIDPTRPVTCGVNIFFNFLSSIGLGVYSDKKAKKEFEKAKRVKKKRAVGSEFFNNLAGLLGSNTMKIGATLHGCDIKTRDAFANMDIAGYNYGIYRYKGDLKKYPIRVIVGTETFCSDAYDFWEMAKKNKRIIGDFVWAGMDYIGEVGIGSWEYKDYAPLDRNSIGWLTAGSGRIDITGKPLAEAAYTKIAFEQELGPIIAVKPVYQTGKHSPSAWKMTEAIESWSWKGCEGYKARVEIYARAHFVELFINKKSIGRKRIKDGCRTVFNTYYENGEILAISYDEYGKEINRMSLSSAGEETILNIIPEKYNVQNGKLIFIRLKYTDKNGILKPMERNKIHVQVEGGILMGLGSACPYNPLGYTGEITDTYYGEALAVVKAEGNDYITLIADDGEHKSQVTIEVI